MDLNQFRKKYKNSILDIAKKRNIKNIRVFGSIVSGEFNKNSDIDFLVNLKENASLLDLSGFKLDLEELLARNVDVVPENSIYWVLKENIMSEAKYLDE